MDNVLGGIVNPNPSGKPLAIDDPNLDPFTDFCYTFGKSPGAVEESFLLPWNDTEALEQTLQKYGDEIAILHFEPLVCNHFNLMPRPGFLEKVRELCTRYGIVMSFDEVITGFRLGLGGAQTYFGITPDIATLGKALGGGVPFSAVVGKADIMNLLIDFNLYLQFWDGMQQEGFITLAGGRWYLSIVHSDEDIDMTIEAADRVMAKL